jgi:hypothetical protein
VSGQRSPSETPAQLLLALVISLSVFWFVVVPVAAIAYVAWDVLT